MIMRIFIAGGCKTGKSTLAQKLAVRLCPRGRPLYYIATMAPADDEDKARITRHREERAGFGFNTVEMPRDVQSILDKCDRNGFFLFDSVTALLANEMFGGDGSVNLEAYKKIILDLDGLLAAVNNIAVVSDYIHSDALMYDDITEAFRSGLARVHKNLARTCDAVVESYYGSFIIHKGPAYFKEIIYAVL